MLSIDFRNKQLFNAHVQQSINDVYHSAHQGKDFSQHLETFYNHLHEYFNQDTESTNQVFSQFLQNLIYYLIHNVRLKIDFDEMSEIMLSLVRHPFFFYINKNQEVTLWVDPKEKVTALNSAVREGYTELVEGILVKAEFAYGGRNTYGFKTLLTLENKDNYSPLNSAARGGHEEIMRLLINAGRVAFKNDNKNYVKFVEHKNDRGFTPLNAASKSYVEAKALKKKKEQARAHFNEINKIHLQKKKLKDTIGYLLACDADPYIKNKNKFSAYENLPSKHRTNFNLRINNAECVYEKENVNKRKRAEREVDQVSKMRKTENNHNNNVENSFYNPLKQRNNNYNQQFFKAREDVQESFQKDSYCFDSWIPPGF